MIDRQWLCTQLTTASLEAANNMYNLDGIAFTIKNGEVAEFFTEALEDIYESH
jgi:hypothetical protein